mmetsp:Transcript_8749/g.12141  ORF Transcript_8749/g.12141 Transcript_8749/m.12141 type:complete len:105 (-) Transcript_8749:438-752(-)
MSFGTVSLSKKVAPPSPAGHHESIFHVVASQTASQCGVERERERHGMMMKLVDGWDQLPDHSWPSHSRPFHPVHSCPIIGRISHSYLSDTSPSLRWALIRRPGP